MCKKLFLIGLAGLLMTAMLLTRVHAGETPVRIAPGVEAPDFELPSLSIETTEAGQAVGKVSENKVRLSSFRGQRPVVLVLSSYT